MHYTKYKNVKSEKTSIRVQDKSAPLFKKGKPQDETKKNYPNHPK